MEELVWKLPLLRRLSGIWRGVVIAGFLTALVSASLIPISPSLPSGSSSTLFDTLAEIGATLLIAYAVEQAALIRALGIRDLPREEFTGFAVAVGFFGVLGGAVALALSQRSGPLDGAGDGLLCVFSFVSVGLLAFLVAVMPLWGYEQIRTRHLNPDE